MPLDFGGDEPSPVPIERARKIGNFRSGDFDHADCLSVNEVRPPGMPEVVFASAFPVIWR